MGCHFSSLEDQVLRLVMDPADGILLWRLGVSGRKSILDQAAQQGDLATLRMLDAHVQVHWASPALQGLVAEAAAPSASPDLNQHQQGSGIKSESQVRAVLFNMRNAKGQTPLIAAALHRKHQACKFLLLHGSRPCLVGKDGRTALHCASVIGCALTIRALLSRDAPSAPDATTATAASGTASPCTCRCVNTAHATSGLTPLHYAVASGNIDAVEALLQHGADMHRVTRCHLAGGLVPGSTPLHYAALLRQMAMMTTLAAHFPVEAGPHSWPDPREIRDVNNRTPFHLAGVSRAMAELLIPPSATQTWASAAASFAGQKACPVPTLAKLAGLAMQRRLTQDISVCLAKQAAEVSARGGFDRRSRNSSSSMLQAACTGPATSCGLQAGARMHFDQRPGIPMPPRSLPGKSSHHPSSVSLDSNGCERLSDSPCSSGTTPSSSGGLASHMAPLPPKRPCGSSAVPLLSQYGGGREPGSLFNYSPTLMPSLSMNGSSCVTDVRGAEAVQVASLSGSGRCGRSCPPSESVGSMSSSLLEARPGVTLYNDVSTRTPASRVLDQVLALSTSNKRIGQGTSLYSGSGSAETDLFGLPDAMPPFWPATPPTAIPPACSLAAAPTTPATPPLQPRATSPEAIMEAVPQVNVVKVLHCQLLPYAAASASSSSSPQQHYDNASYEQYNDRGNSGAEDIGRASHGEQCSALGAIALGDDSFGECDSVGDGMCPICLDAQPYIKCKPCGHELCGACAAGLVEAQLKSFEVKKGGRPVCCPMCRANLTGFSFF